MARNNEDGQILVFVVGLALVVFAVAGLAVDGTKAFIYKASLQNAADAAATAGAAAIDRDAYYASGGTIVVLDSENAQSEAMMSLHARGMHIRPSATFSSRNVTITIEGATATTFLRLVGITHIPVQVVASARAFVRGPDRP